MIGTFKSCYQTITYFSLTMIATTGFVSIELGYSGSTTFDRIINQRPGVPGRSWKIQCIRTNKKITRMR